MRIQIPSKLIIPHLRTLRLKDKRPILRDHANHGGTARPAIEPQDNRVPIFARLALIEHVVESFVQVRDIEVTGIDVVFVIRRELLYLGDVGDFVLLGFGGRAGGGWQQGEGEGEEGQEIYSHFCRLKFSDLITIIPN